MAITDGERRIHERLDEMIGDIAEIKSMFAGLQSEHAACQRVVMGNGKEGVAVRLTRLEERDDTRRRFLALGLSLAGIIAGLAGAFGAAAVKVVWGG